MTTSEEMLEKYFEIAVEEGMCRSASNLQFSLECLFDTINFENSTVLDIGGGSGIYSFYAACRGAREVICLEPEEAGSSTKITEKFERCRMRLDLPQTKLVHQTFQSFDPSKTKFDVILLINSINHLDEKACIQLRTDKHSQEIYRAIFTKISLLSWIGTRLILCDCSRYNFFPMLYMTNPFAQSIDWKKHQPPWIWARFLSESGFGNLTTVWSSFNTLGNVGRFFLGNSFIAFFLTSHFCLRAEKVR